MSRENVMKIEKMPEGGFVVFLGGSEYEVQGPRFATRDIDEALAFMREKLSEHADATPNPTPKDT